MPGLEAVQHIQTPPEVSDFTVIDTDEVDPRIHMRPLDQQEQALVAIGQFSGHICVRASGQDDMAGYPYRVFLDYLPDTEVTKVVPGVVVAKYLKGLPQERTQRYAQIAMAYDELKWGFVVPIVNTRTSILERS